jgi:hypothetical protein
MSSANPNLMTALEQMIQISADLHDPWWLFGSAAMALYGAHPIEVGDIDLLVSRSDAGRLLEKLGLPTAPGQKSDRFHSEIFARWSGPPLAVEILAGFHVRVEGEWRELRPRTRQPIALPCGTVYVPDVPELIDFCRLFARPKDFERLKLLQALIR